MNDSSSKDSGSEPASTGGGPIAQEAAEWLRSLREGWTSPLPKPLDYRVRFVIAGAGTFTWLFGVLLFAAVTEPRFANFIFVGVAAEAVFAVLSVLLPIAAMWFGWLISYVDRRSSPVRLFLEGLLLPAATFTIIALSMGRMPSAPPTPGLDEPRTNADSTSGTPLLSDGGRQ